MRSSSLRSWSSRTELAVGLTELSELRCCAAAGAAMATISASAIALTMKRRRAVSFGISAVPLIDCAIARDVDLRPARSSAAQPRSNPPLRRDRLAIGRLPAPSARPVAALDHSLLVDLRDDLAVAGEQRFSRTHLGAERQFTFRQPVGAVLLELGQRAVRLRPARAVGAFVHLAARTKVADLGILRRPERTGVEAIP